MLASRDFITEGSFLPEVTSSADGGGRAHGVAAAAGLRGDDVEAAGGATPCGSGPTATRCWRRGSSGWGGSTAWMSGASDRWSQQWASWDGYADFWSDVVRDTFPTGGDGGGRCRPGSPTAVLSGRRRPGADGAFADGATATVRVTGPDLQPVDVALTRTGPGRVHRLGAGVRRRHLRRGRPGAGGRRHADGDGLGAGDAVVRPGVRAGRARRSGAGGVGHGHRRAGAPSTPPRRSTPPTCQAGRSRTDLAPWLVLAAACCGRWPWPCPACASGRGAVAHGAAVVRWRVRNLIPARPGGPTPEYAAPLRRRSRSRCARRSPPCRRADRPADARSAPCSTASEEPGAMATADRYSDHTGSADDGDRGSRRRLLGVLDEVAGGAEVGDHEARPHRGRPGPGPERLAVSRT